VRKIGIAAPLALVLTALVTVPLLVRSWSAQETAPSSGTDRERIISCSSRDTVESFEIDGINALGVETQNCLRELLLEEIGNGRLDEIDPVLEELSQESPGFSQFCHTVLHWVGYELGQGAEFPARLGESGAGNCIFGYGHGLLEGFAAAHPEPSDEEFLVAVGACDSLRGAAVASSLALCADGLGHAAWNSTEDETRAAELCDLIDEPRLQGVCAGGVVMQIFAPVNDAGSDWATKLRWHESARERLVGICTNWAGSETAQAGCHSGAGYVYTRPAHVQASEVLRREGDRRAEARAASIRYTEEALQLCDRHGERGTELCRKEVLRQIPPAVYADAELNRGICTVLHPDGTTCPLTRPTKQPAP
jgi:hypothetical protein